MANLAKLNEKQKAAEMMAFDPDISIENIAKELNIHYNTVETDFE